MLAFYSATKRNSLYTPEAEEDSYFFSSQYIYIERPVNREHNIYSAELALDLMHIKATHSLIHTKDHNERNQSQLQRIYRDATRAELYIRKWTHIDTTDKINSPQFEQIALFRSLSLSSAVCIHTKEFN